MRNTRVFIYYACVDLKKNNVFFGPGTIVTMEDLGLVIKSQLFAYYSEQCSVTVSANDTDWQTSRGTDSVSSVLLSMYIGTR